MRSCPGRNLQKGIPAAAAAALDSDITGKSAEGFLDKELDLFGHDDLVICAYTAGIGFAT